MIRWGRDQQRRAAAAYPSAARGERREGEGEKEGEVWVR